MQIAKTGKPARIIAKMNALLEPQIIRALYAASAAGVRIDLIVRGVCALRPGIAGLSENIRVRSVIGRFLEHSRIFYFRNDGAHDIYLSSADWMDRNFFRRIEICFPVLDTRLKKRVLTEGLNPYLKDNSQSWEMDADGHYHLRSTRSSKKFCAQDALLTGLAAAKQD
jgi:polyphosphate kinase